MKRTKSAGESALATRPDEFQKLKATGTPLSPKIPGAEQFTFYLAEGKNQHALWFKRGRFYLHGFEERKIVAVSQVEALRDWIHWTVPSQFEDTLNQGINALIELGSLRP